MGFFFFHFAFSLGGRPLARITLAEKFESSPRIISGSPLFPSVLYFLYSCVLIFLQIVLCSVLRTFGDWL